MKNYAAFTKKETIASFDDELGYKPYYDMMKGVYIFALLLTFVCQALSLLSEYGYFANAFSANLSGYTLIGGTVLFCIIIEASKYFIFKALFVLYFNLTKRSLSPALLILALLISSASMYASIVGGGYLGIDTGIISQAESKHNSEIETIRTEIGDIKKRNSWKGNTYISGKDKALLHSKEQELTAAKQTKQGELQQLTANNEQKETLYRYWFASFEFVFVICTFFTYYFKRRTVVEEFDQVSITESHAPTAKKTFLPSRSGTRGRRLQNFKSFQVRPHKEKVEQEVKQQVKQEVEQHFSDVEEVKQQVEQQVEQQVKQRKIYHKTCENPNCKKEFDTTQSNQIYCDGDCQRKFNEDKMLRKQFKLFNVVQ